MGENDGLKLWVLSCYNYGNYVGAIFIQGSLEDWSGVKDDYVKLRISLWDWVWVNDGDELVEYVGDALESWLNSH